MLAQEKLSFLLLLLTSGICMLVRVQAQQDIVLTSSGELCFGQTVTLTCTHPDPFLDPDKYLPQVVGFIENGEALDFAADSATRQTFTYRRLNTAASTLSFNVTEEDYANIVVYCSCFLTLTGGGREESNTITIDANAQPPIILATPSGSSGLLLWNSPSSSCSNYQYIFTLTWVKIGDGSTGTVSTTEYWFDFTGMPGGEYTANITAAIVGFNLESEPWPLIVPLFFIVPMTAAAEFSQIPRQGYITALAAVSAAAGLFVIIIIVLAVIPACVLVRMRRRRREEGQERKRRADPGEDNIPPVPMTTNPSYAQVQYSTETLKKIPLCGNL